MPLPSLDFDSLLLFFVARVLIYLVGMLLSLYMSKKNPFAGTSLFIVQFLTIFFMIYRIFIDFTNLGLLYKFLYRFSEVLDITLLGIPFLVSAVFLDQYPGKKHKIDSSHPTETTETNSGVPNRFPLIYTIFKKLILFIGVFMSIILCSHLFIYISCSTLQHYR